MNAVMTNLTVVTQFIPMGFPTNHNMYILQSLFFSLIYLWTLIGNVLIITITTMNQLLHTCMYVFLKNFSFLDLCLISVTISKSIVNSLTHNNYISFFGCVTQVHFCVFFSSYRAVLTHNDVLRLLFCHPLHYDIIMNVDMCMQIMSVSCLGGGLTAVLHKTGTFSLSFCGSNMVHQFFYDIPQLLNMFCSENLMRETVPILITVVLKFCCFIFIVVSYVYIFSSVKKFPTTEGQSKTYPTCLPNLEVTVLFLSCAFTAYLKPTSASPSVSDLVISVFYTLVPPTLNPFIYSLRNKAMDVAQVMLLGGKLIKK